MRTAPPGPPRPRRTLLLSPRGARPRRDSRPGASRRPAPYSSPGAAHYMFGPAYGVHKAGTEKMAADMAVDFADFGVATVSIWMGVLLTERFREVLAAAPEAVADLLDNTETPEFTGHLILGSA